MLLNIYLGTSAISWATSFILSDACAKKLKREGYKVVKEKRSLSEKVANFIPAVFFNSLPVYNTLNTIILIGMRDKLYEHMKDKLLEQGKIYKPISVELNNDCESQILNEDDDDKMVNLVPAKCPSCGAQLELDDNMKRAECSFCNTTIIVKADTYTTSVQKAETEKPYDEMTAEEKLACLRQDKEKLINQATSQVENPFILSKRRKKCQK